MQPEKPVPLRVPLPEPIKPNSLRCKVGWHSYKTFELDGTPVDMWMQVWSEYLQRCTRCGKTQQFTFYIERG